MPTMDGLEFIRKIRNDEQLKNTPVILISGANMEYFEIDAMTKIIQKPIVYDKLKEVIERIQY
jgi:CheY-like chemotaxis protein